MLRRQRSRCAPVARAPRRIGPALAALLCASCGGEAAPEPVWDDITLALRSAGAPTRVRSGRGALGTPAAEMIHFGDTPLVAGTIEVWFERPAPSTRPGRHMLACLPTIRSLDDDATTDLFVGDAPRQVGGAVSKVYFGSDDGLDRSTPGRLLCDVPRGLAMADLDGDGHQDLILSMNAASTLPDPATPEVPGEVHVFRGPLVRGQRREVPDLVLEVDQPQGLALLHFDDRPGLDLVVASFYPASPPLVGFSGDGRGGFTPTPFGFGDFGSSAEALAVGDVDRDGLLDVAYASLDALPSLLLLGARDGDGYTLGGFDGEGSPLSARALGLSMADLDADGWLDIVLARTLEDELAVHFNDGQGGFARHADIVVPTPRPFTVSAERDLDHDGHLDLVVANWRSGRQRSSVSRAHLGPFLPVDSGDGPYVHDGVTLTFAVEDAVSLTIGDMDGDGLHDLAFHSSSTPEVPVFLLDEHGRSRDGTRDDVQQPAFVLAARRTRGQAAGEGIGIHVSGGTMPYGPSPSPSDGLELYLEQGELRATLTDSLGDAVTLAIPLAPDVDPAPGALDHARLSWSGADGHLQLVLNPAVGPTRECQAVPVPFELRPGPVLFVGGDATHQRRIDAGAIAALRVSMGLRGSTSP